MALAVLILSGCAASPLAVSDAADEDVLVTSTVDKSELPGFLAEEQDADDVVPCLKAGDTFLDPATIRYQGEWHGDNGVPNSSGYDIYLGTNGRGSTVNVITVSIDDPEQWGFGSSMGNTVVGLGDPVSLQYLPQGTATPPEGWHALSPWVIVKD
jgi:hypothetical protein